MRSTRTVAAALLSLSLAVQGGERPPKAARNWPAFRGNNASGVADGQNLPERWDATSGAGIRWKTAIPGLAHSSPVIWRDRLYVTTAVSTLSNASFKPGLYGQGNASEDRSVQKWRG